MPIDSEGRNTANPAPALPELEPFDWAELARAWADAEPDRQASEAAHALDQRLGEWARAYAVAALAAAPVRAAPAADRAVSETFEQAWQRRPMHGAGTPIDAVRDRALVELGWRMARDTAPPADRAELVSVALGLASEYARAMGAEAWKTAGDIFDTLRATLDTLARNTDAPSERQAWWRQKCPKCGASRTDSPGCQCEDDPGALLRQIRALGDEMKRVGPGVLVPVPALVAEEGRKFMRDLPSLFDRLPIGDVAAATSMLETAALATPPAPKA